MSIDDPINAYHARVVAGAIHADPALAVRSIIFSPMQFGDQMIGVLAVANPSNGLPFTENEFSLVNSLAEQASLAVRNSDVMNLRIEKNRLEMDLSLASNVQALFLTENYPASKELDVDARYIPSAQVGGDFYDFHKIGRSRYAVAIADVSGKGVPASLLMAICQTNLRHFVKRAKSPAEVLVKLNQDLNERMRRDMFITLFLGFIDTDKNTLTFSRAAFFLRNSSSNSAAAWRAFSRRLCSAIIASFSA